MRGRRFVHLRMCLLMVVLGSPVYAGGWTAKAPIPLPRCGAGAATVNSHLYIVGGGPDSTCQAPSTDTVQIYDPALDMWLPGPPMISSHSLPIVATIELE